MRMPAAIIARLRFGRSGPGKFVIATPALVRSRERGCAIAVCLLPLGSCKAAGTESASRMTIRYWLRTTRSYHAGVGFSTNAREVIRLTSFGRVGCRRVLEVPIRANTSGMARNHHKPQCLCLLHTGRPQSAWPMGVKPNLHLLRGSISARPLSGSRFFSNGTGSTATKTSSVGDAIASITWPPLARPSRCPTDICMWSAGLP
jgi:hypothetical protein